MLSLILGSIGRLHTLERSWYALSRMGVTLTGIYIKVHHKFHENKPVPIYQFVGGTMCDKNGGSI